MIYGEDEGDEGGDGGSGGSGGGGGGSGSGNDAISVFYCQLIIYMKKFS